MCDNVIGEFNKDCGLKGIVFPVIGFPVRLTLRATGALLKIDKFSKRFLAARFFSTFSR